MAFVPSPHVGERRRCSTHELADHPESNCSNSSGCVRWSHRPDGERASTSSWACSPSSLRNPREFRFLDFHCSLQEREQSAVWRRESVPLQGARDRALPDRPRLTALHCGVLSPWGPACLCPSRRFCRRTREGARTLSPGRHNGPGGRLQGLPGPRCAKTVGAGAAPPSHLARLRRRPSQRRGMGFNLAESTNQQSR